MTVQRLVYCILCKGWFTFPFHAQSAHNQKGI